MAITTAELTVYMRGDNAGLKRTLTESTLALNEMGRNFETTLRQVAANTAMTDAQMAQMKATVISIGRDTSASLNDLARGYEHAANFGFDAAESAKILDIAMQGAVATGARTADVTNTLAGVMHEFGISAGQTSEVMNTLQLAAAHGNLRLEEFAEVSGKLFSTSANLGLSLNETAAAFSALTRSGLPAAQASTALASAIVHIAEPSAGVRKELAALSKATGIDLVHDFSQFGLQTKGLKGVMDDLSKAVGNNTAEAFKLTGGIRGGIAALGLIGNASKDYEKNLSELAATMSGKLTPVQDAYGREIQTLGQQLGILQNRLTTLGDALNASFSGKQVEFVKGLNEAVDSLTRGFQSLDPAAQRLITTFLGAFAISGPILLGIGALVTLIGGPLSLAIVGITAAISVLAAEWVSDTDKMTGSTGSVQDKLIELGGVLGKVMDGIGALANGAMVILKSIAAIAGFAFGALLVGIGDFQQGFAVFKGVWNNGLPDISNSWHNMMADLNGRWSQTLGQMVQNGYSAAKGFAGAGAAAGRAFGGAFSLHAGHTGAQAFQGAFAFATTPEGKIKEAQDAAAATGRRLADATLTGFGSKLKGGGGFSKPIVDEFQDGVAGLDKAIAGLSQTAATTGFDKYFDKLTKSMKAGGEKIKAESKVAVDAINEFLQAFGSSAKIKDAQLLSDYFKFLPILDKAREFKALKEAINDINTDRAIAGLAGLTDKLDLNGNTIELNIKTLDALKQKYPEVAAAIEKAGLVLKGVTVAHSVFSGKVAEEDKIVAAANADMAKQSQASFDKYLAGLMRTIGEAPKVWDAASLRIVQAADKIQDKLDDSELFNVTKANLQIRSSMESVIRTFEEEGVRLGETNDQINKRVLDGVRDVFGPQWTGEFAKIGQQTLKQWSDDLNKLPGALDSAVNKMLDALTVFDVKSRSKIKGTVGGILEVLGAIPGKLSDIANEFTSWVNRIDTILHGLHKIFQQIPDGLGETLKQVISIFKKSQQVVLDTSNSTQDQIQKAAKEAAQGAGDSVGTIATAAQGTSTKFQTAFQAMSGALASFSTSMALTAATGSKTIGFLGSLATSALAGMQAAIASGNPVIGAVVGGVSLLGGIFGLFGHKSALQKAQEAAALQQAKDAIKLSQQQVVQALEASKQAIASTASQVADLIEKIGDTTLVPRRAIRKFAQQVGFVLSALADELKAVASKATPELKAAAENFQPVVALAASVPEAIDAAAKAIPVNQNSFDIFFSNLSKLWEGFASFTIDITKKALKHAKRFAEGFQPVVDLVGPSVDGMVNFFKIKRVNQSDVDTWVANIKLIELGLSQAASELDKYGVKQAGHLAESGSSILDFLSKYAETQLKIIGIQVPSASDYDNLFSGAKIAFERAIQFAKDLQTEGLQLAAEVSGIGSTIFDSLKSEIDFASAVGGLKDVDFDALPNLISRLWDSAKQAVVIAAEVGKTLGQDLIDQAAKIGTGVAEVVKSLGDSAKAFLDVQSFRDVYPASVQGLAQAIEFSVVILGALANRIDTGMLASIQKVQAGLSALLSLIRDGGAAFKEFAIDAAGNAPTFSATGIDSLFGNIEYAFNREIKLAHAIDAKDLADAVTFSSISKGIFDAMKAGIDLLKVIPEIPGIALSNYDLFVNNVTNMVTALGKALEQILHAKDDSALALSASATVKDNWLATIANMSTALNATALNLSGSTSGASSFGTQSFASSFTPSSGLSPSFGGGSGSAPIVNNSHSQPVAVNFNAPVYLNGEPAPSNFVGQLRDMLRQELGRARAQSGNRPGALQTVEFLLGQ